MNSLQNKIKERMKKIRDEEYNVYQFLEHDLMKCNNSKKKKKWWIRSGGGIGIVFGQYSIWDFYLKGSKYKYEISQVYSKTLWKKIKDLFRRQDSYYEIKAKIVYPGEFKNG